MQFFPSTRPAWIGNFREGLCPTVSGVYPWPGAGKLLVIAKGRAWAVDPERPESAEEICDWVSYVIPAPKLGWLILGTFVSFIGIGSAGETWQSGRISWDGFQSLTVDEHYLKGESWTPIGEKWVPFRLNILTGRHEGGAYDVRKRLKRGET